MSASGQIRAGAAYVELLARDNLLAAGLKRAEAKIKAFGSVIAGIGTKFAALGAAMWTPLLGAARSFAEAGTQLLLMSQRTGVSVEALSALKFAAGQAGVETEDLEHGLRHMGQTIQRAADGSGEAQQALANLGLTVADLASLSPEKQFEALAERVSKIENPTTRGARAMAVFGRNGAALLPILEKGAAGLQTWTREAEAAGAIKSGEAVQNAFRLNLAFKAVGKAVDAIWNTIGGAIAPLLTDIFNGVIPFIARIRQWIKENKAVFNVLLSIGGAVTGIGAGLIIVGGAFKFIALAIAPIGAILSLLSTGLGAVIGLLGFLVSPIGLVVLAIGGIGAAILLLTGKGEEAIDRLKDDFGNAGRVMSTTWQGISDSIANADWAGAIEIGLLGMGLAWDKAIDGMRSKWVTFQRGTEDGMNSLSNGLAAYMATLTGDFSATNAAFDRITGRAAARIGNMEQEQDRRNEVFARVQQHRQQNPGAAIPEDLQAAMAAVGLTGAGPSDRTAFNQVPGVTGDAFAGEGGGREQAERDRARAAADAARAADMRRRQQELQQQLTDAAEERYHNDVWNAIKTVPTAGAGIDQATSKVDVAGSFSSFALGGLGASGLSKPEDPQLTAIRDGIMKVVDNTNPNRNQGNTFSG